MRGPSAPRSVRAGATVETGPLRLTVTAARVTPGQLGPARAKAPADHWVVVLVTAEVTGDESYNQVGRHLTIEGVNGIVDREPTILMVDDADFAEYLHPGVPARLAVAWGQDASAAAPAHLDVRLVAAKYQLDTSDLYAWRLVRDAAVVEDVPVVDRRSPA
ncbi:MAG: hypothetical protein QG622_1671 [Actinomycetota bacterium]|nr:hypothetical protein [Actinomycetota bacterium]